MSGCVDPLEHVERVAGRVESFDEERGVGDVRTVDGRRLFFHCTAIGDGTRTILADAPVTVVVRPGHLGRWEAGDVRPEA